MKTTSFKNFLGINNRLADFNMRVATSTLNGQYLRVADNVDVENGGNLRRRVGAVQLQALTGAHSLFGQYLVRDSVLYAVTLPAYTESIVKILNSNARMSYAKVGDSVYFSNGVDSGRVLGTSAFPVALPTPDEPVLAPIAGALEPGWYQVGVSYYNSTTGEEGGISASNNYERTTLGGLRVTLPAATDGATHICVYLSATNGEVPYLTATLPVGTALFDCTAHATGRESFGRFEEPLPAGTLFTSNGRLCSFSGKTVYVGLPFRPGYYLPAEGYIPFTEDVTVAVENQGGTYVAADKTYWIPGDLGDVNDKIATVLPYGAVPGTAFMFTDRSMCGWFGLKGIVFGQTSGEVEAIMSDNIDLTPPASGTTVVLELGGYRRIVSCGWCVNQQNKAATTYSAWDYSSFSGAYAVSSNGVYELTDAGLADSVISFGKVDFSTELMKHLPACYVGVDAALPMLLNVKNPDGVEYTYEARASSDDMRIQRVDPGKGLRANWFELALMNQGGTPFTMASVSFAPTISTRRI